MGTKKIQNVEVRKWVTLKNRSIDNSPVLSGIAGELRENSDRSVEFRLHTDKGTLHKDAKDQNGRAVHALPYPFAHEETYEVKADGKDYRPIYFQGTDKNDKTLQLFLRKP